MSSGYIKVHAFTAAQALPVKNASVTFTQTNGDVIAERTTNLNGQTALVEIEGALQRFRGRRERSGS